MHSRFHLWPVGQGLFYSGRIYTGEKFPFNFIYDCGTADKQKYLKNSIDQYIDSNLRFGKQLDPGVVDMLVISHFDRDHVSGLPYLLSKVNVSEIYIPYYKPDILSMFLIYLKVNNVDLSNIKLILVPVIENQTDNYSEKAFERKDDNIFIDDLDSDIDSISNTFQIDVRKLNKLHFSYKQWQFKFYNAPISDDNLKKIISAISDLIASNEEDENLLISKLKMKEVHKEFKKIYEEWISEYEGDGCKNSSSNQSSLCLYHAPIYLDDSVSFNLCRCYSRFSRGSRYYSDFCRYCYHCRHGITTRKLGTMLTGDISLVSKEEIAECAYQDFLKFFDSEKSATGIFLVPHHGSKNNWNKDIITAFKRPIFINSSGLGNGHQHPNTVVVNDILNAKCDFLGSDQTRMVTYGIEHIKIGI